MNTTIKNILILLFVTNNIYCELDIQPVQEVCIEDTEFEKDYKEYLNHGTLENFVNKQQLLGQGSFGKVYKANFTGKKMAIKKIQYEKKLKIAPKLYRIEVNLLQALQNSKHFAKMHYCVYKEVDNEIEHVFIFSQRLYKDIDELRLEFIKKISPTGRVDRYKGIAEGLKELHDLGFIQSDLKPDNIISTDQNFSSLRIIDLGLSTQIGELVIGGTSYYYGILDQNKENLATPKFDVFSLGMTIISIERGTQLHKNYENSEEYQRYVKLILEDFKKNNEIKIKGEDNIGIFRKFINFFKKLLGIQVINKFSDFVALMISWNEDKRPSIETVIQNFENWQFQEDLSYTIPSKITDSDEEDEFGMAHMTKFDENGAKFIIIQLKLFNINIFNNDQKIYLKHLIDKRNKGWNKLKYKSNRMQYISLKCQINYKKKQENRKIQQKRTKKKK